MLSCHLFWFPEFLLNSLSALNYSVFCASPAWSCLLSPTFIEGLTAGLCPVLYHQDCKLFGGRGLWLLLLLCSQALGHPALLQAGSSFAGRGQPEGREGWA